MTGAFFIVGPTATGKSEIAAAVASACGGEVVSADAFQIYAGLSHLTAKPDPATLAMVRHHLIGAIPLTEQMNAEQFRVEALAAIADIRARGRPALVVGGSGMYIKALTHGLSRLPAADADIRNEFEQLSTPELLTKLLQLDPATAAEIDSKNRRRLIRAVEICLLTGRRASELRNQPQTPSSLAGVFVFRDRDELNRRINRRVEVMFANGVIDEVRGADETGETATKTLGLAAIRELIAGSITEPECIAQIQQATRRYAKRQLTWFRQQSTFEALNLTEHGWSESIELITRKARLSFAQQDD